MREVVERVRLFRGLPDGEALWKADAPEFLPMAKEEEVNLDDGRKSRRRRWVLRKCGMEG